MFLQIRSLKTRFFLFVDDYFCFLFSQISQPPLAQPYNIKIVVISGYIIPGQRSIPMPPKRVAAKAAANNKSSEFIYTKFVFFLHWFSSYDLSGTRPRDDRASARSHSHATTTSNHEVCCLLISKY